MSSTLNWRKGFFERSYEITSNKKLKAKIKKKAFSQSAFVQTSSGTYNFKTHGIFKKETTILDTNNRVVGRILFGTWGRTAEMQLYDKKYHWQYRGVFNRKWNIISSNGILVNYNGTSRKGQITNNADNELIVAAGLFTSDYFWQQTAAVFIAIFIPIILSS